MRLIGYQEYGEAYAKPDEKLILVDFNLLTGICLKPEERTSNHYAMPKLLPTLEHGYTDPEYTDLFGNYFPFKVLTRRIKR